MTAAPPPKSQFQYFVPKSSFLTHHCDLILSKEKQLSPYASFVTRWWYRFNKYRTVYKNSLSDEVFRSNHALEREIHRHIKHHHWTIHPFSKVAFVEAGIMSVVWFITFFLAPLIGAFHSVEFLDNFTDFTAKETVLTVARLVAAIDAVFRFFLGYLEDKTNEIILDRKIIVRHYLKTYFFFDAVPIVCIITNTVTRQNKVIKLFASQLICLALFRFSTFLRNVSFFMKLVKIRRNTRTCLIIGLAALMMIHWWACILKLLAVFSTTLDVYQEKGSLMVKISRNMEAARLTLKARNGIDHLQDYQEYLSYYAIVVCHFFGVDNSRYKTSNSSERLLLAIITINGLMFYIYGLAKIMEFFSALNISEMRYEQMIVQTHDFMIDNQYPRKLRRRILKYYTYKYNNCFFSEDKIMNGMTEHLRMEVVLYGSQHLVETLHALKGLSRKNVGILLTLFKSEIYLPNETIMRSDGDIKQCYLILHGTCSVELLNNVEILHLEDGDSFGNVWTFVAGLEHTSFIYQVVTLEPCEIYTLAVEDVKACFLKYPALAEKMKNLAISRDRQFEERCSYVLERNRAIGAMDIVEELRHKRILYPGRLRMPPPTQDYYTPRH